MKKVLALICVLCLAAAFAACGSKGGSDDGSASDVPATDNAPDDGAPSDESTTAAPISTAPAYENGMQETFDPLEYDVYTNFFYNKMYDGYLDHERTLTGSFAQIVDKYNDVTRYYVWGYRDKTKCCCYQWEFVPPAGFTAPENGSVITVKGTISFDEAALDKYWLSDCVVSVDKDFAGTDVDYDLTTVSPTLAYVQIANMVYDANVNAGAAFNGKTVRIYGRALTTNSIQDPYYDNYWSLDFQWDGETPPTGQYIVLDGSFVAADSSCYVDASNVLFVD